MAGVCERYDDEDGNSILTYAILTTEANDQMRPIHDRMPVILEPEQEQLYLDLEADPEKVQDLLKPINKKLVIEDSQ